MKIMGIINMTPDSFYYKSKNNLLNIYNTDQIKYADIIDVGCESTRPNADTVSIETELNRLKLFLKKYKKIDGKYKNKILSIDTYKPQIAQYALENGFSMINDITSGGVDNNMLDIAKMFNVPIVMMHMQGTPKTMQIKPMYNSVVNELLQFFENKIEIAVKKGIELSNIIIDPGIGFGKKIIDNDMIIKNISEFKKLGCKVLVGISRKSFLSFKDDLPKDRLSNTIAISTLLYQSGIDIIRVHDIYETYKMKVLLDRIYA